MLWRDLSLAWLSSFKIWCQPIRSERYPEKLHHWSHTAATSKADLSAAPSFRWFDSHERLSSPPPPPVHTYIRMHHSLILSRTNNIFTLTSATNNASALLKLQHVYKKIYSMSLVMHFFILFVKIQKGYINSGITQWPFQPEKNFWYFSLTCKFWWQKINLRLLRCKIDILIICFHFFNNNVYFKLCVRHPVMLYRHKEEINTVRTNYVVPFSAIITQANFFHWHLSFCGPLPSIKVKYLNAINVLKNWDLNCTFDMVHFA